MPKVGGVLRQLLASAVGLEAEDLGDALGDAVVQILADDHQAHAEGPRFFCAPA